MAAILAIDLVRGHRALPRLDQAPSGEGPRVSVVIAARDEARHIAPAVHSVLSQDYARLEVVVVDDRSTDGTGPLLDRLAERHGRLRVLHVDTLPAGWLGKNHALHRGASLATGDLLLFTDADVFMRPEAVRRAVGLLERDGLDHLAVAPRVHAGSPAATLVVAVFLVVFSTFFRPWKAADPSSRWYIGIGAFNLVRTAAYRAIGGHRSIALRPDDDVRLGRALKSAGHRQAAASGTRLVEVEWYPTLGAMARGLRKNAFAVVEYRLGLVVAGTLLPVLFIFWPLAAIVLTDGLTRWLNAGVVALGAATVADTARAHRLPAWTALFHPLGSLLLLWMVWAAAIRAVATGAIEWRGTRYPLDRLRE